MGGTFNRYVEMKNVYKNFVKKPEGKKS